MENKVNFKTPLAISHKLDIAALSVNKAYRGRRFRTKEYDIWESKVKAMLPPMAAHVFDRQLAFNIEFGFSSKASDIDNGLKSFLDVLSKVYRFNDKYVFELNVKKKIVPKGKEYILFTMKVIG